MTNPQIDRLLALSERLREACSREGKPSGVHMIDGQRMLARLFKDHGDEDARDIADVAECMAHCIENEALLFECLKTEALEAADILVKQVDEIDALRAKIAELEGERDALLAERDAASARVERAERNRDMWKGQCEQQAASLHDMREALDGLLGGKCPECKGWGEVAYFGEMVPCRCNGKYQHTPSAAQIARARLARGDG